MIRFIDLFCGIGGFRLGLERANKVGTNSKPRAGNEEGQIESLPQRCRGRNIPKFHNDWITEGIQQGFEQKGKRSSTNRQSFLGAKQFHCVWSCDIDKYARQIYKKNFVEEPAGDITKVPAESIPDHDLLCAGFPCQSFSIAGKRKGFEDTRGTLFFEICRVLRVKRPSYCLLENVKGLLSHDDGKTFRTILESLDELGYDLQWQVLNSKNFGVPQNRERVFIIGRLRGEPRLKIFPIIAPNEAYSEADISTCLDANYGKGPLDHGQRTMVAIGYTRRFNGDGKVIRENHLKEIAGQVKQRCGNQENYVYDNMKIRRLTPVECERLQGFPDGFTEGISDTQRYKCLGNAITTNVVEFLGRKLLENLA